jgi:hypothetical protein
MMGLETPNTGCGVTDARRIPGPAVGDDELLGGSMETVGIADALAEVHGVVLDEDEVTNVYRVTWKRGKVMLRL